MSTTWSNVVLALVLVVALALPHFSTAQSDIFQFDQKRVQRQIERRYCGRTLADALNIVCEGLFVPKKAGHETEIDDYNHGHDDSYPFKSRSSANAMMGRFGGSRLQRQTRGTHNACCIKGCTIKELMSYCQPSR